MNLNKFKNSFLLKMCCFILIFAMLPWEFLIPRKVEASSVGGHDAYVIQTLLNSSGGYESQVIADSNKMGDGVEIKDIHNKHETENYIDWSKYSYASGGKNAVDAGALILSSSGKPNLNDDSGLIFSFPSYQRGATGISKSYTQDYNRAIKVSDTLSSSLNNLMGTVKSSLNYKGLEVSGSNQDISNSIQITRALNPVNKGATTDGNWKVVEIGSLTIYYANPTYNYAGTEVLDGDKDGAQLIDKNGNLMAYITDGTKPDKDSLGFIWAMPKGYLWPADGKALTVNNDVNWGVTNPKQADERDAIWLTIFSIAEYANAQALYHNYTLANSAAEQTNFIEGSIYSLVLGIYSGVLNILKLNTIPELIYNGGTRSGSSYEAGMMDSSWWNTVLKYHLIFQIMAWMMLIAAIAKIILQVNFSTVNPQLTISVMDTLQKIFTVGFALALCIPFIRALATLNNLIVGIFQTQGRSDDGNLSAMGIAGIIILFGYLGITFTMNCIYIMRAVMIAILTASAPLFITSMAFAGPKQKGLFDNWFKEITANIFMQAIHAFAFAFLFDVLDASKVMVKLVIYFSLLPIVDMCRQLVFGQAGGFAVAQGKQAAVSTDGYINKHLKQGVGAVGNKALGLANSALSKGKPTGAIQGADGAGEGNGTSGEKKSADASDRLKNNASALANTIKSREVKTGGKKGTALKAGAVLAGSALNGVSKIADYLDSTGGIMGNAVMQANLGDVKGSVEASKKSAAGMATGMERAGSDIWAAGKNAASNVMGLKERNMQKVGSGENVAKAEEKNNMANQKASSAQAAVAEAESSGSDEDKLKANKQLSRATKTASRYNKKLQKAQTAQDYRNSEKGQANYNKLVDIHNKVQNSGTQYLGQNDRGFQTFDVDKSNVQQLDNGDYFMQINESLAEQAGLNYDKTLKGVNVGPNVTVSNKGTKARVAVRSRQEQADRQQAQDFEMKRGKYANVETKEQKVQSKQTQ